MTFDLRKARRKFDPQDMFEAVKSFPEHFHEGWVRAADLKSRHRVLELDHLVVLGMGGSAIGADLLRAYASAASRLPITVVRDYEVPAWIGERTLVIASSYSGDTEETLSALDEVTTRGASVYAITAGGQLLERARRDDLPHIVVPGGLQPRAALGYSFAALLRTAEKLGVVSMAEGEFDEAYRMLSAGAETLAREDSRALEIAGALEGKLPVVYTGPGILKPVGLRWRNQIQENAKQIAYGSAFAELTHNEIMGWEESPQDLRARIAVVVLRDPGDHPKVRSRMDITRELVSPRVGAWVEIDAEGKAPLARMLTTLQLGDFTSVYMALQQGVDPTPVETIQRLKRLLAGDLPA
jgi:glucose/mannose-6-phosphate isomerase